MHGTDFVDKPDVIGELEGTYKQLIKNTRRARQASDRKIPIPRPVNGKRKCDM